MSWRICDGEGNQLCDGIAERDVGRVAQECADRVGAPVFAFGTDDELAEGLTYYPTTRERDAV